MRCNLIAALAVAMLSSAAMAGGSNYGIAPGALPNFAGKVTEWPVPTPRFARDPAPGSRRQHLYHGHERQQDCAFRHQDAHIQGMGTRSRPSSARPAGRQAGHRVDHRQRQWHHRPARSRVRQIHRISDAVEGRRTAYARHHRRRRDLVHAAKRQQDRTLRYQSARPDHRIQDVGRTVRPDAR